MAESNIELVRRGYQAFLAGDVDALAKLVDPQLKWHAGDPSAEGACVNRDQALRYMRRARQRRRDEHRAEPQLVDLVDAGDRVVVLLQNPDACAEDRSTANVTTVRDGLISEMVHHDRPDRALLAGALHQDGEGHRALLTGDTDGAQAAFARAAELYRRSWEHAPAGSYGRLVGMIKAAILAGEGQTAAGDLSQTAAGYVREALTGDELSSPTAAYAAALAALAEGDDAAAARAASVMRQAASAPFQRAGAAIEALAGRDREGYRASVSSILEDFEARAEHLTGVAIADTALVLERLAEPRGLAAKLQSPLLPGSPD